MSFDTGKKIALIAGAGPAGLTAALELMRSSAVVPIVVEADGQVGGISKTVNYQGNRMDLGGHRFFSKSDWVMQWWQDILPIEASYKKDGDLLRVDYQRKSHEFRPLPIQPQSADAVMLVRKRLSRILYRGKFFDYPLTLTPATIRSLGIAEVMRIGISYARANLLPRSPESSLEDFFVNRFGHRLYETFFKDYTEKVWGVPCRTISAEWGAQRIKGLSVSKAVWNSISRSLGAQTSRSDKTAETSLIEHFLYPKLGPGQMWEEVARRVILLGGTLHLRHKVIGLDREGPKIKSARVLDLASGNTRKIDCDYFISTMPVKELVSALAPEDELLQIAESLPYRAFITAGLLLRKIPNGLPPDNWIYIQEPDVRIGRLQVFNNWSPAMVADPRTAWLGLEYFCDQGDRLWAMSNSQFLEYAARELESIGLIDRNEVIGGTVERVPDAYPAYFGSYSKFFKLREYLDRFPNLYPIGRNGMHRYNNQDHSMLTAKAAVGAITRNEDKSAIWLVNTEGAYHEQNPDAQFLDREAARQR